jgi:hypothetical protein
MTPIFGAPSAAAPGGLERPTPLPRDLIQSLEGGDMANAGDAEIAEERDSKMVKYRAG